jgi:phosphatidylglycerophosphatase A
MRTLVVFIASAAYVGYIPIASGTFGTIVAIPIFWAFAQLAQQSPALYLLAVVASILAACWVAGRAEAYLQEHDSGKIVIDEVVGFLAATLFLPASWSCTLAAFVVFRILDVIKPFPAGWIDANMPGGYGVTLDDVVSGLYTNLVLHVLLVAGLVT